MKIEKRRHPIWDDRDAAIRAGAPPMRDIVGEWQYIYSSDKGNISLVELLNYFGDGRDFWEIMSIEPEYALFEDVERYRTKEQAEERIRSLLEHE